MMRIVVNNDLQENEIAISHNILPNKKNGTIEIGMWKKDVVINRIETEEEIHVPEGFFPFHVPLHLKYKWKETQGTLKLGPVIAFLVTDGKKKYSGIKRYKRYMSNYPRVNGIVFISTVEQTDFERNEMKGFFYDPVKKDFDPVERTFPFPDAVYRRCNFRKKSKYHLLSSKLNNKIFNGPVLNKYKQYQTFLKDKKVLSHFPNTKLLKSIKSVEEMLMKYSAVYMKPISSYKAKGIVTVCKKDDRYIITENTVKDVMTRKELIKYIKRLKKNKRYILQQAVPCIDEKNIVFRAIMQKNEENRWMFTGGYSRVGSEGSVVTNRLHTKEFLSIQECFQKYYQLSQSQADDFEKKLVETCLNVCRGFDKAKVNFGDLAFDIMVDHQLKIWVIEVNNRAHNHRSPLLTVKDRKLYRKVVSTPLLYAKYLSGF